MGRHLLDVNIRLGVAKDLAVDIPRMNQRSHCRLVSRLGYGKQGAHSHSIINEVTISATVSESTSSGRDVD